MAQGFAEALGSGKLEVYSAGSNPSSAIDQSVIEVMKEKGIDLSSRHPKGKSINVFREVRDMTEEKVKTFLKNCFL